MAKFTTRVVLHGATPEDYDILHEAMEDEGFSRTITDSRGIVYRLPHAEYNRVADLNVKQIYASASVAAEVTGLKFSILVTQAETRYWSGLDLDLGLDLD